MLLEKCYENLKGDYSEIKKRLLRDEVIEKFLLKFPNDKTMENLRKAVLNQNIEESFREAHTLKGLSANLGFTNLTNALSPITEQLRSGTCQADKKLFTDVEKAYQRIIDTLEIYVKEKQ